MTASSERLLIQIFVYWTKDRFTYVHAGIWCFLNLQKFSILTKSDLEKCIWRNDFWAIEQLNLNLFYYSWVFLAISPVYLSVCSYGLIHMPICPPHIGHSDLSDLRPWELKRRNVTKLHCKINSAPANISLYSLHNAQTKKP